MKKLICLLMAVIMLVPAVLSVSAAVAADEAASAAGIQATEDGAADTEAPDEEPDVEEPAEAEPAAEAAGELAPVGAPDDPTEAVVPDIPRITSAVPVKGGVKLSYTSYDGAAKYRVFYKADSGWKKIGDTTALTYSYTGLTEYTEFIFTVRAVGSSGKYVSGYDKEGYAYTYYPDPVLKSAASAYGGMKITWLAMDGAVNFRVYEKADSGWTKIGDSEGTSFLYTKAKAGKSGTYTVRVYDKVNKKPLSYYDTKGISAKYIEAPEITAFTPVDGGVKVSWTKPEGAAKVRLFYMAGSGWTKIGDSESGYFTHKSPADRTVYTYTVRAMDANGKYISGYKAEGWENYYIAPPAVTSVTKTDSGWRVRWQSKAVYGYRVYRKEFGASWEAKGVSVTTVYKDKTAKDDTLYAYTVRCLDENSKAISYYVKDVKYYYNGALADGKITSGGNTYNFVQGSVRQGFVTIDGKTYYFDSNGEMVKNAIVGSEAEGWRYADKNGVISDTTRLAVSWGGYNWNVLDGVAYKVVTAKDKTLHSALKKVAKITKTSMTKAQKLRACFDYLQTETSEYNPRVPHYRGTDWPVVYANDIFNTGGGNCFSYAAAFGFMAKAIGYDKIYACSSGGHGWTEIGGKVYDPEWQRSHHTYSYYGISYDSHTDVNYAAVRANFGSAAYMHVKI